MSYSGYYQLLCEHGHYFQMDCYEYEFSAVVTCPHCKGKVAWWNLVDTTNGLNTGDPFEDFEILAPQIRNTCPVCHHTRTIEPTRFKIPTNAGYLNSK